MKRKAICKNCGYPILRLFRGGWIHNDPTWQYFACPVQQAIDFNVNGYVWVKLTPADLKILENSYNWI
jgi:hypothetical protein